MGTDVSCGCDHMEPEECIWTRRSISSHVATCRYRSEWTWIQFRGWDGAGVLGWDRSDRMSPTSIMWVIEGAGYKREATPTPTRGAIRIPQRV